MLQPVTMNQNQPSKTCRLELLNEFKLNGVITSIGVVQLSTSVGLQGMNSLLLTFKDAKMSLIEYSQGHQTIITISTHYYEKEKEESKRVGVDKLPPKVYVDPQNRCATLWFYNDRLAILPFKQDSGMTDDKSSLAFLPSFVVPFVDMDPSVKNVIDVTFLHGFFEPTIAILFQTHLTCTG